MFKYLKKHLISILYGVVLFGFTCYLLMDTFLISQVYRVAEKTEGQNIAGEDKQEEIMAEASENSYEDGSFEIITEEEITAEELLEQGAKEILSFGPALIENGTISVTEEDEVGKAMASNPRTAIGIIDDLHYVFVVSDGRTEESEGLSLLELAEFMDSIGVETAYNLDGGGSSTMYFNGAVVNNPTTSGRSVKERSVSDIVCIGY